MVIALLLQTLYSYIVHPILFFFFILLVVRLYFCYKRSIHSITYIALLDSLIGAFGLDPSNLLCPSNGERPEVGDLKPGRPDHRMDRFLPSAPPPAFVAH